MQELELTPVICAKRFGKFDLSCAIKLGLRKNNARLRDGDVLVVSSKFIAMSEGRYVNMSKVTPTRKANSLARNYSMEPALAQLVLNESDRILGGVPGFVLAISNGVLAPNAGIDKSNVPHGYAILYPKNPKKSATNLRNRLLRSISKSRKRKNLGVVISDSRIAPTRLGTVGVALAVAGMRGTLDLRGSKDLFGNELKVTVRAVADQIATAAELLMGEASESVPVVVVRGLSGIFGSPRTEMEEHLTISPDRCLVVQGLMNALRDP